MAEGRHLEKAPIVEAIIDLQVKLPKGFDVETFSVIKEQLNDTFPKVKKQSTIEGVIQINQDQQIRRPFRHKGVRGFIFSEEDDHNVAQFRIDGFTFSELKPYTCWKRFSERAHGLWSRYLEVASPEVVTRVAVRYINRLSLPLPVGDLREYLTAPPTVAEGLPKNVKSFLSRVVIEEPAQEIAANIIQVLEGPAGASAISVILDIDVYRHRQFEPDDLALWESLGELRYLKNQIFFANITDKTARMCE